MILEQKSILVKKLVKSECSVVNEHYIVPMLISDNCTMVIQGDKFRERYVKGMRILHANF